MKDWGGMKWLLPRNNNCCITYRSFRASIFWLIYDKKKNPFLTSSIKRNGKDTISWRDSKNRIVDNDFSYGSLAIPTSTPPDCTWLFRLWTSISSRKLTLMFNPIVEKLSGLINSTVPLHLMFFINDPKFLSSRLTRRFSDCLNCCSFWLILEVLSFMFILRFIRSPFIPHFSSSISAFKCAIRLSFSSYSWMYRSFTRISFSCSSIKWSEAYHSWTFLCEFLHSKHRDPARIDN